MRILWLCRNWDESIRFTPELWKSFSLRTDPASGSLRCMAGREFFLDLVTDSPRGCPFGGSGNHRTRWIEGNNSRIKLNTTIFIGESHFIRSFFQLVTKISPRGGCNSGGGAGEYRSPQERYENLFMSISPEPIVCFLKYTIIRIL